MAASAKQIRPVDAFADAFTTAQRTLPGSPVVQAVRERGFERFQELGIPTTRAELWKYTNVAPVANVPMTMASRAHPPLARLQDHFLGGPMARRLIFINGHLDSSISHVGGLPEKTTVISLARAIEASPDIVAQFATQIHDERSFTELNAAFLGGGAVIELEDGVQLAHPLQILFVTVGEPGAVMTHPRVIIRLGERASCHVIESHIVIDGPDGTSGRGLTNLVTQLDLGNEAKLSIDRLQLQSHGTSLISKTYGVLGDGARLDQTSATFGGTLVRNESELYLRGSDISCTLNGVYVPRGTEHVDTMIRIHHEAPSSRSDQFYKGVVFDRARAAFQGKIFVQQPAQKTNAFQKNDNLLLSDDAEVDTKPELEIYADDVKCSHGATIGDLDADSLFYLRARGLPQASAEALLTYAFAGEVFERFGDTSTRKAAHRAACARLPGGEALLEMV